MQNYFITFDLAPDANDEERPPIANLIHQAFAPYCVQALSNGWFVRTAMPAEDLRLWLLGTIHPSWHGYVIRITSPMFGFPADLHALPEWLLIENKDS